MVARVGYTMCMSGYRITLDIHSISAIIPNETASKFNFVPVSIIV